MTNGRTPCLTALPLQSAVARELIVRETLEGVELRAIVREHSGSFPAAPGAHDSATAV